MLFTAGTLNSYIKTQSMQIKANQRLNNVNMKKGTDANSGGQLTADTIQRIREDQAQQALNMRTEMIRTKLKSGMNISSQDLDFLRENAPDLYTKTLQVIQERKAYEESLKRCRTKEEVERVKAARIQQFATEAQSIQQSNMSQDAKLGAMENLQFKLSAIVDQHGKFIKTAEYAKLPTEEELRRKKEEKEQQTGGAKRDKVEIRDYHLDQKQQEALDALKKQDWQDSNMQDQDMAEDNAAAGEDRTDTAAAATDKKAGSAAAPAAPGPSAAPSPAPAADPVPAPEASPTVKTPRLSAGARA